MAGVYNSFEIKFDFKGFADRAKPIAENLFNEIGYKVQEAFLLWDDLETSDGILSGEVSYSTGDDDLQKSREIFAELCKRIVKEFTMAKFMAKHSYDYSNTDATEYMLCFREKEDLVFYRAEVVDDLGCMQARKYTMEHRLLDFRLKDEQEYEDLFFGNEDDSNNDFMQVLEAYDSSKYPKKKKKSKSSARKPDKPIFEAGKYYKVVYLTNKGDVEIVGRYDSSFAKTYSFKLFGKSALSDTEYIEEDDIRDKKEVFPTDETKKLVDSFKQIEDELEDVRKEMTKLKGEFYSLYSGKGDSWERRKLETVDIGQSYPGIEKLEIGNTYLVNVKNNDPFDMKVKGVDAVLVVNCFENALGEQVRVMGCHPFLYVSDVVSVMPVVASNIDEFTEELLLDEQGAEVQRKRLDLYNKMNGLKKRREQILEDYQKSFIE